VTLTRTLALLTLHLGGCAAPDTRSASRVPSVDRNAVAPIAAGEGGFVDATAPLEPPAVAPTPAPMTSASTSVVAQQRRCAAGMAAVSGGAFQMGELGNHVAVRPFCLDLTEVTADAYAQCVQTHKCNDEGLRCGPAATYRIASKRDHPINCVSWPQADKYCRAQGKRLPTEEEWEWAARGQEEAREYPWGEGSAESKVCWSGGTRQRESTCRVGEFVAGDAASGIHDLAGNVWEWTSSSYNKRDASRVNRGGGWISNRLWDLRTSNRYADDPTNRTVYDGFRCAK
jgi:formylglycine-generating enzyme